MGKTNNFLWPILIIVRQFFSFCNTFSTLNKLFFRLLVNVCIVHGHIIAFFLFLFRKTLISFMSCFSWFYLTDESLDIFICAKKKLWKEVVKKLIMICIIYKISVLLEITWITLEVVFSNVFSREYNRLLFFSKINWIFS